MPAAEGSTWLEWRSADFSRRRQFEEWNAALNDSYLDWDLEAPDTSSYFGEIQMRNLGGIRLLHCRCDPCHGRRGRPEISRSTAAFFGLLLVYGGREHVRCGEKDIYLDGKGFMLWDSVRPLEFQSYEGLRKVTLLVPQELLRDRVRGVDERVGESIDIEHGIGAVTASHLSTLVREAKSLESRRAEPVLDLTLELVAACLQGERGRVTTGSRARFLAEVRAYIEEHLDEADLGPRRLAEAFRVSSRYIHLLFADAGISVSAWILQRRLEQCRLELAGEGRRAATITDIAFRWGFNDSAHFCHVFKKRYGLSPRDYRKLRRSG
jgi:AraC family transcriptional activator of tynA and feaB